MSSSVFSRINNELEVLRQQYPKVPTSVLCSGLLKPLEEKLNAVTKAGAPRGEPIRAYWKQLETLDKEIRYLKQKRQDSLCSELPTAMNAPTAQREASGRHIMEETGDELPVIANDSTPASEAPLKDIAEDSGGGLPVVVDEPATESEAPFQEAAGVTGDELLGEFDLDSALFEVEEDQNTPTLEESTSTDKEQRVVRRKLTAPKKRSRLPKVSGSNPGA